MKVKIIVMALLLNSSAFAATQIIGGTKVTASNWIAKTVVALVEDSSMGEALCTASLVAPDLAVTAAHCVTNPDSSPVEALHLVFATDLKKADASKIRAVDRVMIPSQWKPAGNRPKDTSDVALVHFAGGLPSGYSPSDLLPFDEALLIGQKVILAGYGISDASADTGAGILRKTEVTVEDPTFSPTEIQLDQSRGGGACHGDSGGPAFIMRNGHPLLFGITSRGEGNCDQDVIYTKIVSYAEWFAEATKKIRSDRN